ncbi:carbon storage regulator [Candidatus Pacearchaeota archaeon]|nr:carbon storage regulator [Candidatus Pacearchaeota archaeon]
MTLILGRYKDEELVVADMANKQGVGRIFVVDIKGDKVRLGFDVPDTYTILRKELVNSNDLYNALREGRPLNLEMMGYLERFNKHQSAGIK